MEYIQKIKNHLNDNARNYIEVFNVETEKAIAKMLFLDKIKEQYGSVDGYFTHLLKQGIDKLQVQMRYKMGAAGKRVGLAMPLNLSPEGAAPEKIHQSTPGLANPDHQNFSAMQSANDISTELLYKSRISDLEEKIIDLKKQLEEERTDKREINRKLQGAYDEIRELKVAQATAEKEKDLALREAEVSRKSFFETEFAKTTGQGLIGMFNPGATNAPQEQSQLHGAQLSRTKQNLIHWVSGDGISDEGCEILYQVATQMHLHNDEFTPKLLELIKEYQSKTN